MIGSPAARGCVFDTNRKSPAHRGRFDLVVYDDGIAAIHGNYIRTAMLAARAGAGVSGPSTALGAVAGASRYDRKRFAALADRERDELLAGHSSSHFLPTSDITGITLRRRWYEHALQIDLGSTASIYRWKPRLNSANHVIDLLTGVFGAKFVTQ